jgi:peptide/nickel transport system ATP-binding protein
MTENDTLLQIEDLYVNFHTSAGIVKAIDGVSLRLNRSETFGLVGETGCGKSVTAYSILRLLPIPPAKILKGRIIFYPMEVLKEREEKLNALSILRSGNGSAKEIETIEKEIEGIDKKWNLLERSPEFMRQIRGKYISMIFQEPMTALNPVFSAGDQVAESFLLHERQGLAISVVRRLKKEKERLDSYRTAAKTPDHKGGFRCSNCKAEVLESTRVCPDCNSSFVREPLRQLTKIKIRYNLALYERLSKNSNDILPKIMGRIPILRRYRKEIKSEALRRAEMMLRLVRIPDPENVIKAYPHELSGGMQQRVMIAMALACKPQLLIADEPTTALDVTIQAQILKLMRDLQEETGTAILLITHNLGVVAETCQRVGIMYAGVMAEVGPVRSIFKEPLHPYTQGLMNSIPRMTGEYGRLETIEGNVPNLIRPPSGCRFHPRCPYAMETCKKLKPTLIEVRPGHHVACHLYGRSVNE